MTKPILLSLLCTCTVFLCACSPSSPQSSSSQTSSSAPSTETTQKQSITLTSEEVAKHNSATDCWFIIDGSVYDVTSFENRHPGGKQNIVNNCGTDASAAFHSQGGEGRDHPAEAKAMLPQYLVGKVGETVER